MHSKDVKIILKFIKDNNMVISKDIAFLMKKESRYPQGFLDALEGVGLIEFESKATMKLIKLTERGKNFLGKD